MINEAAIRRDPVPLAIIGPRPAGTTAAELTVTIRISADAGQAAQLATRLAETLRTAFELSPVTSLEPHVPAQRERWLVPPTPLLHIHVPSRTVRLRGVELELTRLEFDLLLYLARNPGRICTRRTLLSDVWETPDAKRMRTVDVHIRRLRGKLGPDVALITTVRQVGYRLDDTTNLSIEE